MLSSVSGRGALAFVCVPVCHWHGPGGAAGPATVPWQWARRPGGVQPEATNVVLARRLKFQVAFVCVCVIRITGSGAALPVSLLLQQAFSLLKRQKSYGPALLLEGPGAFKFDIYLYFQQRCENVQ